jgi:hypothetical protein
VSSVSSGSVPVEQRPEDIPEDWSMLAASAEAPPGDFPVDSASASSAELSQADQLP